MQLFRDPGFNFDALWALGAAGEGASEVGEVLTAVNTVTKAKPSYQTFADTFQAWGDRLAAQAAQAGRRGHRATQRARALRASRYYAQALFYVLGTDAPETEEKVYLASRRAWDAFADLFESPVQQAAVPYGTAEMPVWFFRPDEAKKRRPTVILTNGSDGQNVDMWSYGVAAALERGWNALVYEGPGQGQMLFVDQIPFTDRWERVVTALVDYLYQREDVACERIALTGLSMGGNLAPRAAAFEHRIAALVAMPGVLSPWLGFPPEIREVITQSEQETNRIWNEDVVPALTPELRFLVEKRFEPFDPAVMRAAREGRVFTDVWTPAQRIIGLDITNLVGRIKAPTLVLDYDDEQFYPGQPRDLFDRLRSPKEYIKMTAAEGAQLHCSPMAPQRHCEVVFDWLDQTLHP
ncbi:S9 family peptidase [Streptomyces sp. GC420]|uniref:alpha/beta hydrolase family protein n=1 Tax=Streptomyces sp. GC420 TaxID=2697568 RepID=UPI00141514B9|nr:alpha/beta fold hydrolase [Streptomyces sp. GC420]NBM20384.1 alpha/beta fold hydrolase [Streptomyces sp. GC420]